MASQIVKQIAHTCIFAHDLEETANWYRDVLGMEKVFNFTRDGKVFGYYLDAGGRSHIEVFIKSEAAFSEKDAINHICFEVHDLDAAIAHIRGLGYEARDKSFGCDETYQSWVTDPNGVKIELFEYTDKSAQFTGGDRVAHW